LALANDGNIYGTTESEGAGLGGTAYKINPSGVLTTLHSFCTQPNCADGAILFGGLTQGVDGNFYGATTGGGAAGTGTIFKLTPQGTLTTLPGLADGLSYAGLAQGIDGSFYGTTYQGGGANSGTVFKMTPAGSVTALYSFCSQPNCVDGYEPYAGLVLGTDGNFYGTTTGGGQEQGGTVFKVTPNGALTTLHNFCSQVACTEAPYGEVVQDTNGTFFGTASDGGSFGAIFTLSVGLRPFVRIVTDSARVGQTVAILGQGFLGTTRVSFNGMQASFIVVSGTFIRATVPAHSTSGPITVTTPRNKLTSNVPFQVIP